MGSRDDVVAVEVDEPVDGSLRFHFGVFSFAPLAGTLHRDGRRVRLRPQQARALSVLLSRAGEVVSRDELRQHLWGSDTYLDVEAGLNTCIRRLRSVLDDEAGEPRFIQTVPGRGYRFIAPVALETGGDDDSEPPPARSRRRVLVVAVALVVAVLAAWYLFATWSHGPVPTGRAEMPMVLLGTFDNRSGEEILDDSLEQVFRIGLAQSKAFQLLTPDGARGALARMGHEPELAIDRQIGIEICKRDGAAALVMAGVSKVGGRYVLYAEVVEAESGRTSFGSSLTVDGRDDLLASLDTLSRQVRAALGESLSSLEAEPARLPDLTTTNLEALKAFSEANRLRATDPVGSAVLLQHALDLDPGFAMAHVSLGVIEAGRGNREAAKRHLSAARQHADRLTEYEALYVAGHLATLNLDVDEIVDAWSLLQRVFPGMLAGYINHSYALITYRNDFAGCVDVLEQRASRAEDPWETVALRNLGTCQLGAGRLDEALETAREARRLGPDTPPWLDVEVLTALRRYAEAEKTLAAIEAGSGPSVDRRTRSALLRATWLADQGRYAEAGEASERAEEGAAEVSAEAQAAAQLATLSYLEAAGRRREVAAQSGAAARAALAEQRRAGPESLPDSAVVLSLLGTLAARNGDATAAAEVAAYLRSPQAEPFVPSLWHAHLSLLDGEVLAARGERHRAVVELRRGLAESEVAPLHALARLAEWYEEDGDRGAALVEWRRVAEARGRAVAECIGGGWCADAPLNLLAQGEAVRRLAAAPATTGPEATR